MKKINHKRNKLFTDTFIWKVLIDTCSRYNVWLGCELVKVSGGGRRWVDDENNCGGDAKATRVQSITKFGCN